MPYGSGVIALRPPVGPMLIPRLNPKVTETSWHFW